jgi:hypothetical protein
MPRHVGERRMRSVRGVVGKLLSPSIGMDRTPGRAELAQEISEITIDLLERYQSLRCSSASPDGVKQEQRLVDGALVAAAPCP